MYNYPFIRLIRAYISSLFSEKVTVEDKTTISMRCSIGDIDPYWEMNNGRYQQLADIGRFNHGFRTGFFIKDLKNKISFTVAGTATKYRYRIPFGKNFTMTTKVIYVDEKWTYYYHEFIYNGRITSTILARTGMVKNGKLVRSKEASKIFNLNIPKVELPLWVADWIKSDESNPAFVK